MFLIRSRHPRRNGPTLNTISPEHPRRARHLATCEELAELGMDIARAAHREALRDLEPRAERRTEIPSLYKSEPPYIPPRESVFAHLFIAISRCVRQTMLLETRLADGALDHPPRETQRHDHPTSAHPASDAPDRLRTETLSIETLVDETRTIQTRTPDDILAGIRAKLDTAANAIPPQPAAAKPYRRPIPIIPPGPEAPFTQAEKSALMYHAQNPRPRKPDG